MGATTDIDRRHLARAIELAEGGRGRVSPNPLVGAVIGRNGQVIGEGYHHALGSAHAEVEAIRSAEGQDLAGTTLYVSVEPCCHHGRTPPCTDAILRAGIGRVVVASEDPSLHASGRGLGILRDEGVEVIMAEGELAERARLPGVARQPRSIVFDSMARLPLESTLVQQARQRPLTVVVSRAAQRTATDALSVQGVDVVVASGENETARVRSALEQLGAAGV